MLADADAPQEGTNKLDYYNKKFGADRTAHMVPMMKVTASMHYLLTLVRCVRAACKEC